MKLIKKYAGFLLMLTLLSALLHVRMMKIFMMTSWGEHGLEIWDLVLTEIR